MKLKYVLDCQVLYKEGRRERVSELKSLTVFGPAYNKDEIACGIILAFLTRDISSKSSWGPYRELSEVSPKCSHSKCVHIELISVK
jgi:hypothetical protein